MILLIGGVLILTAIWLFAAAWMPDRDMDTALDLELVEAFAAVAALRNVEPATDSPWRGIWWTDEAITPASHLYRLPARPAAANSRATTDDYEHSKWWIVK